MRTQLAVGLLIALHAIGASAPALAQPTKDLNARELRRYLAAKEVTVLDWELVQFNLEWQGSYSGAADYLTSHPVAFDRRTMQFRASFRVQNERSFNDAKVFFSLSKVEREAILTGAAEYLVRLLSIHFPEVKTNSALLQAVFTYEATGGGSSIVATYDRGRLLMAER